VDVALESPDVVTDAVPGEPLELPEPPDEHAANRHTDAHNASHERRRFTLNGLPDTQPATPQISTYR
jgi:hypothetical protein